MPSNIYSVYRITCKVNNKHYIGITTQPVEMRWKQHIFNSQSKKCKLLSRAMQKHGIENFEFVVLEKAHDIVHLKELERKYIEEYKSYCNRDDICGYNMTLGGDGVWGLKMSEEVRIKISDQKKLFYQDPHNRERMSELRKGINHTEESKKKISDKLKGRAVRGRGWKMSEEQKKAISDTLKGKRLSDNCIEANIKRLANKWQVTSPTNDIYIIENLKQFCKEHNLCSQNLWKTSKGIIHQSQGWKCIKL